MGDARAFTAFIAERRADLRRIAGHTRGDATLEDVQQTAWVMAAELAASLGRPMNFAAPEDQELLIGRLYNELVAHAEKTSRYALRIDDDADDDGDERPRASVAHMLRVPADSEPPNLLEYHQEEAISLSAIGATIHRHRPTPFSSRALPTRGSWRSICASPSARCAHAWPVPLHR